MSKRMDARDTVDAAIHHLAALQSEGWRLESLEQVVTYDKPDKKSAALPTGCSVIVKLRPI